MKKVICLLLTVVMLAGCSAQAQSGGGEKKLHVVSTVFPQYDWMREILGEQDDIALTLLVGNGVDLHSYQPSAKDILLLSQCDLFVYIGGDSDQWVEQALRSAPNPNRKTVNLLDVLGDAVKTEEIVDGMQHAHDHDTHAGTIYDRSLSEWAGDFTSIAQALSDGDFDDYTEELARENRISVDEQKKALAARWESAYLTLSITDSAISFGGTQAEYQYIGYQETNGTVWYGFAAQTQDAGVPLYVAFSDHGTGRPPEGVHAEEAEHAHEDEHAHGDAPQHFHFRYGDEGFAALAEMEDWAPTYFVSALSGAEAADAMQGHAHKEELDEHVWLSLRHAKTLCTHLADTLCDMVPARADAFRQNLDRYVTELDALDRQFQDAVNGSATKTLLFGDRFPFRYLADDYGLSYYAAFPGCSAETEASFDTIVFLTEKVNTLGLRNIMVIENADPAIAHTIRENSKAKDQAILTLHSMQAVTEADIAAGVTYLQLMRDNLAVLRQALQ